MTEGDRVIAPVADRISRAAVTVDILHRRVHEGVQFIASYVDESLPAMQAIDLGIIVPPGVTPHLYITAVAGAQSHVRFFEGSDFDEDGTELIAVNRNRLSDNEPETMFVIDPTVNDPGDLLAQWGLAGGSFGATIGSAFHSIHEWNLAGGAYLLRLSSLSNQMIIANIEVDFYEPHHVGVL